MKKKLRVTFIIPFTAITGGVAVVLEYHRQLTNMGHEVNIVYPLFPYREYYCDRPLWKRLPARVKQFLLNRKNIKRTLTHFSEDIPVKPVAVIRNFFIPDADAVIATAWPTAYSVSKLSPEKGGKFYFVQDYEIWQGMINRVDATYRLPFSLITISPWLTDLMKEKFNRSGADITEIHNGIRLDKFHPPAVKDIGNASILVMAHGLAAKGTQDAIDALAIVRERRPQLKITMFGMCPRPSAPFDFEYHRDPPHEKLLSLYQDAAVFIFPAQKEGWGLTPIEAMACGCALVAANAGCIPLVNNGENMILAEAKNPVSIAAGVIKLLEDKALAERIAAQGLKTVRGMGWEKSAQIMLNCLLTNGYL